MFTFDYFFIIIITDKFKGDLLTYEYNVHTHDYWILKLIYKIYQPIC